MGGLVLHDMPQLHVPLIRVSKGGELVHKTHVRLENQPRGILGSSVTLLLREGVVGLLRKAESHIRDGL